MESTSKPTWFSLGSPKRESKCVSNSTATKEEGRPSGAERERLVEVVLGERKKARPSPEEAGLRLLMEKVKVVEKEAKVVGGWKSGMG